MNAPMKATGKTPLSIGRLQDVVKMTVKQVNLDNLAPRPVELSLIDVEKQVREDFSNLEEFARSLETRGLLQPILLLPKPDGRFLLVAGERRLRAAALLKWKQIDSKLLPPDTDAIGIRAAQVQENIQREDLSAKEQAAGVIADVENYGVEVAAQIWGKTASWISKRVGTAKYGEVARALMNEGISNDFEVLHSMAQLEQIDPARAKSLDHEARSGGASLTRDRVRSELATAKELKAERQRFEARKKPQGASEGKAGAQEKKAAKGVSTAAQGTKKLADTTPPAGAKPKAPTSSESEPHDQMQLIEGTRTELFTAGGELGAKAQRLAASIKDSDLPHEDVLWKVWVAWLDVALPTLHGLGADRAKMLARRLAEQLKEQSPLEVWSQIHAGEAGPNPLPAAPTEWRF